MVTFNSSMRRSMSAMLIAEPWTGSRTFFISPDTMRIREDLSQATVLIAARMLLCRLSSFTEGELWQYFVP